jgi:hypothetical protein
MSTEPSLPKGGRMTSTAAGWVLGVDPGAKATGVVVRYGNELAYGTTALRDKGEPVEEYAAGVVKLAAGITERFADTLVGRPLVAIEAVLAPNVWNNGDRAVLHPQSVMDTCTVAGHIAGWATAERIEVEWVRPGHNGQGFMGAYPVALRPTRGKGAGKDRLRHLRSAWDVAGAALLKVLA